MERVVVSLLVAALIASGCQPDPTSGKSKFKPWLGLPTVYEIVLEVVHKGTGRLLDKNKVSVEAESIRKSTAGFVSDMTITVTDGDNTFSTTAIDIPCDQNGIPTDESVDRIREAAEEIKEKISRFQN